MPINFSFRRRKVPRSPGPDTQQLQSELNTAIEKLVEFSSVLRQELAVANVEEAKINPPDTQDKE